MIEEAVFAISQADTALAAAIETRFYPILAPQAPVYPYCVYHVITENVPNSMGAGTTDLVTTRIQIDVYGEDATSAIKTAKLVTAAYDRYQGTVAYEGGSTVVQDVYRKGKTDLFDEQARKFKRALDFEFNYLES